MLAGYVESVARGSGRGRRTGGENMKRECSTIKTYNVWLEYTIPLKDQVQGIWNLEHMEFQLKIILKKLNKH